MLTAVGTNGSAGRASAAAVANDFGAVLAKLAVVAEMPFTAGAFTADAAFDTKLIGGTVRAFFAAFLADYIHAV